MNLLNQKVIAIQQTAAKFIVFQFYRAEQIEGCVYQHRLKLDQFYPACNFPLFPRLIN
jgi:hypothetical protein